VADLFWLYSDMGLTRPLRWVSSSSECVEGMNRSPLLFFYWSENESQSVEEHTDLALILTPAECASMKATDFLCQMTGMLEGSVMKRWG